MPFAILQECTVTGRKHYVYGDMMTGTTGGAPGRMQYMTRDAAVDAAGSFARLNKVQIEATRRRRDKGHPCKYTVEEV
jgi:hypothetical protein